VLGVLLALLLWPEVRRYRAEHELRTLTTTFQAVAVRAQPGLERDRVLAAIDAGAGAIAAVQPGDSRALMLAGSARLMARDASGALDRYRAALARGERAEIDLGLARAHLGRHDTAAAQAALVRAAWVSPALAHTLPKAPRRSLLREVKLLARELRAGRLDAPPALADVDRPARPE
jgi:hypothetical protein